MIWNGCEGGKVTYNFEINFYQHRLFFFHKKSVDNYLLFVIIIIVSHFDYDFSLFFLNEYFRMYIYHGTHLRE